MSKKQEMLELLEEEREIRENRIIAEKDGAVYVNFHDAAVLNSANAYEGASTGMRTYNPDGSIASTGKRVHAVNPDYFFLNRYKVKGTGQNRRLYVVSGHTSDGFRLISEQATGRCFIKSIPCYVLMRNEGKLELEKTITIRDTEFLSEFNSTLNNKTMAEILPLIVQGTPDMTADDLPI